ncbi:MAG: hypothetical protein QXG86_01775 [Candidatus Woesearchaeota archaeon]
MKNADTLESKIVNFPSEKRKKLQEDYIIEDYSSINEENTKQEKNNIIYLSEYKKERRGEIRDINEQREVYIINNVIYDPKII